MTKDQNDPVDCFAMLHPVIQEELYRMRWQSLRPIQERAIAAIVQGDSHLIISAPTAGGKTEAAFLPILSLICEEHSAGVRAIYVGPLKALINDQFRRLEDLCERASIPVHKWHGDVSATSKKEVRANPTGVLLITPESIESLFINYPDRLKTMFRKLSFIVIDEFHSFLDNERGAHLRSLLCRLCRGSGSSVRLVALSATFGDDGVAAARKWIACVREGETAIIKAPSEERILRYQVKGYLRSGSVSAKPIHADESDAEQTEPDVTVDDQRLVSDIFRAFQDRTGLVFGNNKSRLEFFADLMSRHCDRSGIPNPFRVHTGSLAKAEREETEDALRSGVPTVAFCSSTLEMGIDVGNIKWVGQLGAPWSVASLTQRLGRSGRGENDVSEMRLFVVEDEPESGTRLIDRLFPELLQAVAMSELLISDKWCEPPRHDRLCVSTLVQQIMSLIKQYGGAKIDFAFDSLIRGGGFRNVSHDLFLQVLRSMKAKDLIEQTPKGELILGLLGEQIAKSKDFYAAFMTGDDFAVIHGNRQVGSVALLPGLDIDQYLILAGKRWRIQDVDYDRKKITVVPAAGGRLPRFSASGGADIHPHVREKMRHTLFGDHTPVYLDAGAQSMLQSARKDARTAGLDQHSICVDGRELTWFTWTGTRIQRTLMAYARMRAGLDVFDNGIALVVQNIGETRLMEVFRSFLNQPPTAEALAANVPMKTPEKYDRFLSDEIQAIVFGRNCIDVQGTIEFLSAKLA